MATDRGSRPASAPAGEGGPSGPGAPDRLYWNLAILLFIPVLVLLLVAAALSRRDRGRPDAARSSSPDVRSTPPGPAP